ncbi:MAG: HD domain-containing protein [bacterium]|nr:HD domain-containing protein [bacterium]
MKKLLALIQVLDNLCRMPRSGGLLFAGIDPNRCDSIADHNFKVVSVVLLLGELFKKNNVPINFEHLLKMAITHDWTDSILLDIPSSSPSYSSYFTDVDIRKISKNAEAVANAVIAEYIATIIPLELNEGVLSKEEKDIISIADITVLLTEALEWKYQGLRYEWIDYLWSNTMKRLESVAAEYSFLNEFINELQTAHDSGIKPANPFLTKPEFQGLKK